MKLCVCAVLCLFIPVTLFAADTGYKVTYDGGSLQDIKARSSMRLVIEPTQIRLLKDEKEIEVIPANTVNEISYGQDVHRRVGAAIGIGVLTLGVGALMALTKSKKHFVGLTYAVGERKGGFAMQCDKNEYRGILAGITGKKAVDSETMNVKN